MSRRYRIARFAVLLLCCYAVPHRVLELIAAHQAGAAQEVANGR
jgi:hypothetical protein